MTAKEQYPFILSGAFSQEAGAAFSEASANGLISTSRILRSAGSLWLAHHRALVQQGFSPLNATDYLLKQTEAKQPPAQPQPSFVPPMPSPIAPSQPMNNGKPHAHP
jgi:hypothetical protein